MPSPHYMPAMLRNITNIRLASYEMAATDTDEERLACYLWNGALSAAIQPIISLFEVGLN